MELNRAQIIKALDCFHQRILRTGLAEKVTEADMMAIVDAITLIREQAEKIERLSRTRYMMSLDGRIEMIPSVESVKSETVRKMRERLHEKAYTNNYCQEVVLESDIDQIAKELLEETK